MIFEFLLIFSNLIFQVGSENPLRGQDNHLGRYYSLFSASSSCFTVLLQHPRNLTRAPFMQQRNCRKGRYLPAGCYPT